MKSLPKRKTSRFSRLRERNKNGASREAAKNAKGILLCKLGDFIRPVDVRNSDSQLGAHDVMGINISKTFMPSVANLSQTDLSKYKIVETGQFVYSPMQVGRDECVRVALYTHDTPIIVSPAYVVFEVTDQTVLIPEFLFLWFSRPEFDRYGWFLSDGSVRSSLEFSRFCEIQLPVPPIARQREIVAVYQAAKTLRDSHAATLAPLRRAAQAYLESLAAAHQSSRPSRLRARSKKCASREAAKNAKGIPLRALGDFIRPVDVRNSDRKLGVENVKGISIEKTIIETKCWRPTESVPLRPTESVPPRSGF